MTIQPGLPMDAAASRGRVLFVITEDWFFVSHFLPLAQAVRAAGYDVSVHLRINDPAHRDRIERSGIRVLTSTFDRGTAGLAGNLNQVARYIALFRREAPDIVHLISLRVVILAGVAARRAGVPVRVHALTGLGLLGTETSAKARSVLAGLGFVIRRLGVPGAGYVFENEADPRRLGIHGSSAAVLIVGGAGIDPDRETALPLPPAPPLRLAVVSRMIRSKGIGVAVEAVGLARVRGVEATLTLVGDVDSGNPRSLNADTLRDFARQPGVTWLGRSDDVRAVWRDHHVACVPSLGGEGLPRALLEAAAAARPIITTDTPGCATFVRPGLEGLVVPPNNADALADAIATLASDLGALPRLGAGARARALDGFTVATVAAAVIGFYQELAAQSRRGRQVGG